ncbi:hypothetical protein Leryth_026126 [Lithospermum erythrorhizon]|nr:hypothetical protein Leryth_026126 [Lithospermum erythrorhizon]
MLTRLLPPQLSLRVTTTTFPPLLHLKPPHTSTTSTTSLLTYGPSLHTTTTPILPTSIITQLNQNQNQFLNENELFDENIFTRIYDIAALRVPAEQCAALERRLRGHLLNWPRLRNIGRVPGDEIDKQFHDVIQKLNDDNGLVALNRRIYGSAQGDGEVLSGVLYRDKLVQNFNSKGYLNFRNLAKLSRPKKKKEKENRERGCGIGKNEMVLLEVVEDEGNEEGDLSGLLGEEFKGRKWKGSTRLLLLDERYAHKTIHEMPEAIKAALEECNDQSVASAFKLVKCKLTLLYDYWHMDEVLEGLLPGGMVIPSGFEIVGHIAHLNLKEEHLPFKKLIAKVVLDKNKPKIQTVVNKTNSIQNQYRTMQLEVLAGNHSLVTTVVENGLRFHVDLSTVYWNSRLSTERQRLINIFTKDDVICDVFAGVGPISISAAKKVRYVYANDLNPYAVEYLERNCVLNKLERKIEVYNMDGRRFISTLFVGDRTKPITQVIMNLPNDAVEFLDAFKGIFYETLKKNCILPKIHVYGFSKADDPEFDFLQRIQIALSDVSFEVQMHRVRLVAPGKWMLCASFSLPERIAYAENVSMW